VHIRDSVSSHYAAEDIVERSFNISPHGVAQSARVDKPLDGFEVNCPVRHYRLRKPL
jgi:hypothetical protein